ncbi:MAG: ABC transporter substrate-binding protein [Ketobacteraceae bacterium]|nr:ABC transporter substrate-binding protein [Ketobacteraceae bacterium]
MKNDKKNRLETLLSRSALAAVVMVGSATVQAESVFVGHLADLSGATSFVGKSYAQGVTDALNYVNQNGGIDGVTLEYETHDYAYKIPQAIGTYKRWKASKGMVAMQGWGTGDTEALISFVARDEVPNFSASYSAHLTDPQGKNPETKKPAPYNFFYGPSYSDGARALVTWAREDWDKRKQDRDPVFVFAGTDKPYAESMRPAAESRARELGFVVKPNLVVPLGAGDKTAACLSIKNTGADYVFNGNLGGAVLAMLRDCEKVGVTATIVSNVWGVDRGLLVAAKPSQPIITVAATPSWESDVEGMSLVRKISALSDPEGNEARNHHYLRGVCSVFYMKEAMQWAKANGGITGPNIKQGMYQKKDWVPEGLNGVCQPSTWTAEDHRGTMNVNIIQARYDGKPLMSSVAVVPVERRAEWLGN